MLFTGHLLLEISNSINTGRMNRRWEERNEGKMKGRREGI